jgi:hypothetical protein
LLFYFYVFAHAHAQQWWIRADQQYSEESSDRSFHTFCALVVYKIRATVSSSQLPSEVNAFVGAEQHPRHLEPINPEELQTVKQNPKVNKAATKSSLWN